MNLFSFKTPVAFFVFNRPSCTAAVLAEIRRARPSKLLIVADGPRANRPGESGQCAEVRTLIEQGIDWPCEVTRNYAESNLGCRNRVSSGLDWVFSQVEEAIILEDDVLPHQTFFAYCQELLERYREDERVMVICGSKLFTGPCENEGSYHFIRYPLIWGWATWRRTWKHYDVKMLAWPEWKARNRLRGIIQDPQWASRWETAFEETYAERLNTWDNQLAFACLLHSGLSIFPARNLISNIGFGPEATHTTVSSTPVSMLQTESLPFPLRHPEAMFPDTTAERAILLTLADKGKFTTRLKTRLQHLLNFKQESSSLCQ